MKQGGIRDEISRNQQENGQRTSLHHSEVNDMDYDSEWRVIVFGTDQETYYLLADSALIIEE